MKKGLIICSTPYQLMIGAILRKQIFTDLDCVDLIITDTFEKYQLTAERIKDTSMYSEVYIANIRTMIYANTINEKIRKIFYYINFIKGTRKLVNGCELNYDEIYYNCNDIFTYNLISAARSHHKHTKVFRYEEGYSTYINEKSSSEKSRKIISLRNRILNVFTANKADFSINGLYALEPQLIGFDCCYPVYKIQKEIINTDDYTRLIEQVFQTKKLKNVYKRKYIIFEESFVSDGIVVDDMNIYRRIIKAVGRENVSVKLHPRTQVDRFSELGVDVHKADGIPWEAVLLSGLNKSAVLIALASGSVINSRLLTGDSHRSFLVYRCLKKAPPALNGNFSIFLEKFQENYKKGLYIPHNMDELLSELAG